MPALPPEFDAALWSLIFQDWPDAVSLSDRETGAYLEVNARLVEVLGRPRETLIGRSGAELGLWIDPQEREAFLEELAREGRVRERMIRVRDAQGRCRLLEMSSHPIGAFGRSCLLTLSRDCTALLQHEAAAEAKLRLLHFAQDHDLAELLRATLDEAEALVDSRIAFFHFLEPDEQTLRLQAWSTRTARDFCRAEAQGSHYPVDQAGVWVDCIRERRPVIHNDYAALPHRKGLPPGHAELLRELVVPVIRGGRIVAILGVGNKPLPYDALDVEAIRQLADQAWDVAERKRAEAALQASEARFRGLFEAMKEGFALHEILTDAAGRPVDYRYLEVNPAFEAMTGIPREQWIGRTVREILPGTESGWIENYGRVALTGEPWETESYTGTLGRWYQVLAFSPGPRLFAVLANDITQRKQAEAELEARAQERQVLLAAASVAKVLPFRLDEARGRLHLADSALEVLGQPAANFHREPQRLRELLRAEDRPLLDQALAQARSGGQGGFETALRRGEHQTIWARWTLRAVGDEVHGVIQDITEAHELQAQLLQSQKLESLGTMLSGITHDFNNLLMSILGYAEVLRALPELPPQAGRGLEVIHRAAERGKGLVEQLLRFTRKGRTDRAEQNLNATAREVQGLLSLSLEQRIRLELDLDPALPVVLADPGQLHQVLMNLATNARDAIPGEGRIRIRTGQVVLGSAETQPHRRPPGAYAFVEVEDTGMGMPREVFARAFEPFFTTKPVGKGTGLGLSVVHGIVEAHGGILHCDSEVGKGTRFRVLLPLLAPEPGEAEAPIHLPAILLLAEPGEARDQAQRLLESLGYPLSLEADPLELLAQHGSRPFGLILLDPARQELWSKLQRALRGVPLAGLVADPARPWPIPGAPVALLHWPIQAQEFLQTLTRLLGALST